MTMGSEVRVALQKFVRTNKIAHSRPTLVRAESPSRRASLDVNFDNGSVMLKRDKHRFRLVYESDDETSPQLQPGEYKLLGYMIRRQTEDGEPWFISTCGIRKQTVEVDKKPTSLKIDSTVYFDVKTKVKDDSVNLQLGIKSDTGSAITIYKKGKRVPATYELRNADGERIAQGSMQYG